MDTAQREQLDQEAFDESMQKLLSLPLEKLRMKEHDWQKFDKPCPPSNSYVYAVQSLGDIRGKKILDYGCGNGYLSTILAKRGGLVWGFDTSGQSVEVAKRRAVADEVESRIRLEKMSCYELKYEDEMFDLVIGLGVLHHIDIGLAGGEISRVLKDNGRAVFEEPFANSGVLRTVRRLIPIKPNTYEGSQERPLTYQDVKLLATSFRRSSCKEFLLLSRLNRIITNSKTKRILNIWDQWLLDSFPILRRYAGTIVIELIK